MPFGYWVWTKKITEWYKKCGERTRNFLWRKKSGVGGTSAAVTLSWDHGRRMRDQGSALQCSLFLRVPMALPVCYTGRHLSNWLYCYVGIYLLLTECVPCAVGIWCHVFEANISEWWENEREANSGPVLPWKGMLLSPVAVKDHEAIGDEGDYGKEGTEFQREAFEMIWVSQALKNCTEKNVYSQW